jgi:hypothetical protein
MSDLTTTDVLDALDSNLDTAEVNRSDLANGVRVAVDAAEAGLFYKSLRELDADFNSRRVGDSIVAHIEAEEGDLLRELFM